VVFILQKKKRKAHGFNEDYRAERRDCERKGEPGREGGRYFISLYLGEKIFSRASRGDGIGSYRQGQRTELLVN